MTLESIRSWSPFSIDALGLVTMIGAEEVDRAIGRLIFNPWTEYLPLLGAFVIAGNRFIQPIPGVVLYNITDGIMATDVAGWVPRWLAKQDLNWNTNAYVFSPKQITARNRRIIGQGLIVGSILNSALLVLSVLMEDWFGFANTMALIVSVIVRWYMLEQCRYFLDRSSRDLVDYKEDIVKVFCVLVDGRAVTLFAPRGFVLNGLLTTPQPAHEYLYKTARAFGWLAFGLHVICIGQATLAIQIITVVIMIIATVATIFGIGCDEFSIGRQLHIHSIDTHGLEDRRTVVYARLKLTDQEEQSMLMWGLFPQRNNLDWWARYHRLKVLMRPTGEQIRGT
ncbi:hypothetical protein F5Y02DRAFT_431292 [Annulohypoxylon stygium]|nr:hypothetical protein F5Y02DRAFT_431292 [Annulohypoxylon stygium]